MKRPSRKIVRSVAGTLSALTLTAIIAGCGSTGNGTSGAAANAAKGPQNPLVHCPSGGSTAAQKPETGNITLNVTGWSSSPAEDALVQKGLSDFHAKYPTITVNWSPIPQNYDVKMKANVAAGDVADVFYVDPSMAQEYIPSGKLLDLSPYMGRDNVAPDSFYSNLMKPFDCADGSVYGIAKDWNSLGLFYNKTMFQQAGLSDPSTWTWSDLQSAAQKLTSGKVHGIALPADASRFGAFLVGNGGQMLTADGKTAAFNSPAGTGAAQFYTSFEQNKTGVMPSDTGAGWDGEAFGKGQVAMTFEGGWMIPYMTSTYPGVQYGIAPMPTSPTGVHGNLLYTNAWGAYSGTKHADAAWKLVQFMTSAAHQQQVLEQGFALPTVKSLESDPYFTQNPGVKVLQDGAQAGVADFYGAADTEVHTDVSNALQSVMLGKSDVPTALSTASQKVNTFISQNVAP